MIGKNRRKLIAASAVIAAGSMLETLFDKNISFPIGRVEFKVIRPVSFPEFLSAIGEIAALEQITQIPIPAFAQTKLLSLFHTYALIVSVYVFTY